MMYWEAGWGGHGIGMLVAFAVLLLPFWRITTKAGYSGFWSLLMFVPFVNLLFLYILAFSRWPALRRRRRDD